MHVCVFTCVWVCVCKPETDTEYPFGAEREGKEEGEREGEGMPETDVEYLPWA